MVGLYRGLNFGYVSWFWVVFRNSVSNSNMRNEVSSAKFWGLILKEIYSQERILIHSNVDVAQFGPITITKTDVDVTAVFPTIAQFLIDA